ncbi:MAG TPA: cellulase family glycosylhydrolase [Acidimicrobiales bacterium]|nr:cellulase family glycosylhydrolase [Acidimicrobiales bacterium]
MTSGEQGSGAGRRRAPPVVLAVAAAVGLVLLGVVAGAALSHRGASIVAAAEPTSRVSLSGYLRADGGPDLTDQWGRVVVLHGVNAVYKRPPFELYADPGTAWNFTQTDAADIASLGFDVVRLGIIWQGIEPGTLGPNDPRICTPGPAHDPGQWNEAVAQAYLDRVARTVAALARYHVYTLLDMHEDVYSTAFGGEGAPMWAVCTSGLPIGHLPGRWSNTYADPALGVAVRHFWTNDVGGDLQGEYQRAWKAVATRFAGNPWVVGYDPINEPFTRAVMVVDPFTGPSTDSDPEVAQDLECFYTGTAHPGRSDVDGSVVQCPPGDPRTGIIPVLEQVDPRHPVFFEPDIYTSRGRANDIGPMEYPNLVFNFHAYCGYRSPVTGDPTNLDACVAQERRTMARRVLERPDIASHVQPAGPALFMSEFGATSSDPLMARLTAVADSQRLGWIYWAWKYYGDPTGSSNEALVQADGNLAPTAASLSRTYPMAVAGTPTSFTFDPSTAEFHLDYVANPLAAAPTLVFVPVARHYPAGYCATAVGGTIVSRQDATHLVVRNDSGADQVSVKVVRGRC